MSMSRQDFVAIAAAIKKTIEQYPRDKPVIKELVYNLLPVLQGANSLFKRGTFLEACGLDPKELP